MARQMLNDVVEYARQDQYYQLARLTVIMGRAPVLNMVKKVEQQSHPGAGGLKFRLGEMYGGQEEGELKRILQTKGREGGEMAQIACVMVPWGMLGEWVTAESEEGGRLVRETFGAIKHAIRYFQGRGVVLGGFADDSTQLGEMAGCLNDKLSVLLGDRTTAPFYRSDLAVVKIRGPDGVVDIKFLAHHLHRCLLIVKDRFLKDSTPPTPLMDLSPRAGAATTPTEVAPPHR